MLYVVFAAGNKKLHEPSFYRALIREMKTGHSRSPTCLLQEAYKLQDPYFLSLALFDLSCDARLSLEQANKMAHDAFSVGQKVTRLWHKAELISLLAKKTTSWRDDQTPVEIESFQKELVAALHTMPNGKELDDAIKGCAPYLSLPALIDVLSKALMNEGFELSGGRTLIRNRVRRFDSTTAIKDILPVLNTNQNKMLQAKLFGYLLLQCREAIDRCSDVDLLLPKALDIAQSLNQQNRMETFRYLARMCNNADDFDLFKAKINQLDEISERTRLLTTLGGYADKSGLQEIAITLFDEAENLSFNINDSTVRINVQMNIAQGYARCNKTEKASQVYTEALSECSENERLHQRVVNSARAHGIALPNELISLQHVNEKQRVEAPLANNLSNLSKRHIIALYDTYEGNITPAHLRAIARATPLCVAFDMDLALMGFPCDNLSKLIEKTIADTNVGKGGVYLRTLVDQQRILLVSCDNDNPCGNSNSLGIVVATTSHPDAKKQVTIDDMIRLVASSTQHNKRACFIMGLGKKGLPQSLLRNVKYHVELTGRNISLETCTAMGVIACQVYLAITKTSGSR